MSALVCCGPCFAPNALAEDGSLYPWLSEMLSSTNDKVIEVNIYVHIIKIQLPTLLYS